MSGTLSNLGKALMAARAEFRRAEKDSQNPHLKNRFASLAAVMEACEDALTAHGLTFTQPPVITPSGPVLRTVLIHVESGETMESECPLLFDANGKINPMQALGSAISYARRYSLESLLGILREDDDAEGAFHRDRRERRPEPRREQAAREPARPAPEPARTAATNGTTAAGKPSLSEWLVEEAKALGIHRNQLVHHLAKVAVEGGTKELDGLTDPAKKVAAFSALCRGPKGAEWKKWVKARCEEYRDDLEHSQDEPQPIRGRQPGEDDDR